MPTTCAGIRFSHAMRCHLAWRGLGVRIAPTTRRFAADKAAPRLGTTFVADCVKKCSGPGATPACRHLRAMPAGLRVAVTDSDRGQPSGSQVRCTATCVRCIETGDRTRTTVARREDRTGEVRGGHWSIPNHSRSQPAHSAMPAISERKTRRRIAPAICMSGGLLFRAHATRMQRVHLDRRESLWLGSAARSDVGHSLGAEIAAPGDHAHRHAAIAQVSNELLPCDVHVGDDARRAVSRQAP